MNAKKNRDHNDGRRRKIIIKQSGWGIHADDAVHYLHANLHSCRPNQWHDTGRIPINFSRVMART